MKTLFLLSGPTAVGKSELALRWAEVNNAEIINADAYCFYRGMDIGTAKPSHVDLQRIPHHCLDYLSVTEPGSIIDYHTRALSAVREIDARNKLILITGGSGFYLQSFLKPISDGVSEDPAVREQVDQLWQSGGLQACVELLLSLNPDGVGELDLNNPRRVVPALRRCIQTGKSVLQLRSDLRQQPDPFPGFEKRLVVLERDDEDLWQRIQHRTWFMLNNGLLDEVRALRDQGLETNPAAANAIGYRETLKFLRSGSDDLDALAELISVNTRKLVRKQRAWFRNQCPEAIQKPAGSVQVENLFA
ncbi:MAG: tRNA (adenosine(37)-N6)-dimethylallyltransferase MiaA [Verrucomicrobia bacterium]|nr:tRNA (adenosine(37)-N6)-dimethylallyltransferase MiaA [Verrucomicrobiota bacterium]